jgi:hypothetical protein
MDRKPALRAVDGCCESLRPSFLYRWSSHQPEENPNRPGDEREQCHQPTGLASQLRILGHTPNAPDDENEKTDLQKKDDEIVHDSSAKVQG